MERITIPGLVVAYERVGPTTGTPLVLLHGFTGHRDDFIHVTSQLSSKRPVLVPDLRGHGDSGRARRGADYTFEACVDDLLAFLDALALPQCDLLGHSMGGMVGLRFALQYPDRLRSLILMSTSPSALPETTNDALAKGKAFLEASDLNTMQKAMESVGRGEPDPVIAPWAEHYWSHHRRRYQAMDPDAYHGFASAMIEQDSVAARLDEIALPTSILVGTTDREFHPGSRELSQGIAGAMRNDIEGAGHHPHEEERDQFFESLERHFRAVEG